MINLSQVANKPNEGVEALPDLTTLLDILFILLVFFILTAGAAYRTLDLTLPEGAAEEVAQSPTEKHYIVEIKLSGYALDGENFGDFDALKTAINKATSQNSDKNFIVAGDKAVSLERFLILLTYLQSRGIETANILMKKEFSK
ncbi:MAG: biopolymer transporter ExbD [Sneathiella sp.]|nr:biopolymer transporter ExbD [Sneathiella sp.]